MKPLIGITSSKISIQAPYAGAYVADGYFTGVAKFGGIPIILPLVEEEEVWKEIIQRVDGVIFTGGSDIHPQFYGEGLHPKIGEIYPFRDRIEIMTAQYAMKIDKPILGICRGIQLLNVAKGGTLYQDINGQLDDKFLHMQTAPRYEATHYVNIEKSSKLFEMVGVERVFTNSFHHQAIKDLALGFRKVAESDDGIIEAFESTEHTFVMGVQFHPEMMWHQDQTMAKIGQYFIDFVTHFNQKTL
ncbi:gamma-glutamyl-gamma-aminobutyrate hydrolase family protein [Tepidibacillus sp. HK-1]|uniref:gamma-glutamyl-gamma-aminobutyrate hydrolase family protein n=1 Tax=Tepidibacillus sp. HK-1 TaxID=1883407 RepID=UPI000852D305|nr:gamma-glutamyl-gamma-aminobutyrate hydrolase family protein [Tepidibacillus sp. HK-1]GBF10060.1 putative glutamine amidotransferase [Tepidibacillus sp. HK-1]